MSDTPPTTEIEPLVPQMPETPVTDGGPAAVEPAPRRQDPQPPLASEDARAPVVPRVN